MVRLYIQLKSVDTLKGYILPKGKQAETSELLDLFDVNEVQKKLIENYQDNASIEMTLDNRGTLEMQVKQLQKDLKGTSWLPRIKKKLHNDRVSKLGKIIKTDNLKRRGFFSPDNFFTGFVYGTLGMFTMFNGMGYLIGGEDLIVSRDRKSTRLNSSHIPLSRMPSSA